MIDERRALNIRTEMRNSDTVYLSVVDEGRLAVSFINSVYDGFGSCIVTPETGIALQNRGACFVTDPAHPNCIGPGKRPLHTIIPAMVKRNGQASDAPRYFPSNGKVLVESALDPGICAGLQALGHVLEPSGPLGGGQAIAIDHAGGMLIGGSDPRKDGLALGY
jgi:gamma-glutamyltranspeptidase/glutathione hydrolase